MTKKRCVILLPVHYNDGTDVPKEVISGIKRRIDEEFDGHHVAGLGSGTYRMADGSMATDVTLEIWIAVDPDKVSLLKKMTSGFARMLKQETIYFEVMNSEVEFIDPESESEG